MKQQIIIKTLKTDRPQFIVEIGVRYSLGGMNMFAGIVEPRGYWLFVQPCEVGDCFRTYGAFSGTKSHILESSRFSQGVLERLAKDALQHPKLQPLIQNVCAKGNITLTESV